MKLKINIALVLSLVVLFAGCENPFAYQKDTHSRGMQRMYVEESFKPLMETSINTFEGQFPLTDIIPVYCTEAQAMEALYSNKTNTVCVSKDLTPEERKRLLQSSQMEIRSTKIAYDAIALLINHENADSMITIAELKDILTGKTSTWWKSGKPINVVFDNMNSANFRYLHELIGKGDIPANIFAVKSNEEVIKYVKEHPSALGIIGVNWISDEDDKVVQKYRSEISQMWVAKNAKSLYFQPYQGSIMSKDYPLIREVWLLNKGSKSGLNTGFVNWMEKENGQLLIQKAGLVAADPVERKISIKTE